MAIATYSDLKLSISEWINWDDLSAQIPTFIRLSEAAMRREIRHWKMEAIDTLTASTQYTDLPADFIEAIRVSVDSAPLRLVSLHVMQEEREKSSDTAGTPVMYSINGGKLELFPTPSEAMVVSILYYADFTNLSDTDNSNWILTDYPDAYLYGALMHAAPYLAEDARAQTWGALYGNAIREINQVSDNAKHRGAKVRRIRAY